MADRTGQQLGNYRILRLLGKGGFAGVYLGEHIYLQTLVAIKVLDTQLTPGDMQRFLTEARTIARLAHPHIVRVIDFGRDGESPFLVMDYAPHGTLRQRYPRGTILPLPVAVMYASQAATALQHAHNQHIIHRDIKPENMLLGQQDELLLSDFGIATIAHRTASQFTQDMVGTVAYMAPEQVQGKPRPASDQYALAVIVYEWLSGACPFQGTLTEIATQQILTLPPPLHEKAPGISPAVEQVVMTALSKDPKQRFAGVLTFASSLEQACQSSAGATTEKQAPYPAAISSPVEKQPPAGSGNRAKQVWGIGRRQLLAMLIGLLLYANLSHIFLALYLRRGNPPDVLWLLPAVVIPLFCGVVFGPWVGLVIGGFGFFIGDYISARLNIDLRSALLGSLCCWSPRSFDIGFMPVGFIAGLSMLITGGRLHTVRNVALAVAFSIAGIVIGFFAAFNHIWGVTILGAWGDFAHVALPNIILTLVMLPFLLVLYNRVISRREY